MYSTTIKPKVDVMFDDLRKKVSSIVTEAASADEAIGNVQRLVGSELATRSKSILSDMLFNLSDNLMKTEFFADITRQNKFYEINLRQEILSKYQFTPGTTVNYKVSSGKQALKVGGTVLFVGGVAEIGYILIKGLSFSDLKPISIFAIIVASISAALADYFAIEPIKSKKVLAQALDSYLVEAKQQFLNWFDEVENHFNKRVEEIKQTL